MTRLPIVDAKAMEGLLLQMGFVVVRQKGSLSSIVIMMDGQLPFLIIKGVIFPAH